MTVSCGGRVGSSTIPRNTVRSDDVGDGLHGRYASAGRYPVFIRCVLLSSPPWAPGPAADPCARILRQTVLAPLSRCSSNRRISAALERYDEVVAQRDSAALAATFLAELRSENLRLRGLLGLGPRLGSGYIPAEVLHQEPRDNALTFLVSAGRKQGVKPSRRRQPGGPGGHREQRRQRKQRRGQLGASRFRASAMAATAACTASSPTRQRRTPLAARAAGRSALQPLVPDARPRSSLGLGGAAARGYTSSRCGRGGRGRGGAHLLVDLTPWIRRRDARDDPHRARLRGDCARCSKRGARPLRRSDR